MSRWLTLMVGVIVVTGCGDDGNRNVLADAPTAADAMIDAMPQPPAEVALVLVTAGPGHGAIVSDPAGIDCGPTCAASFPPDTVVSLTATPEADSVFVGWSGACTGTTPICEVTLADAASVTATFALKTYTVTVTRPGAGTGTVTGNGIACGPTCSITVDHGTMISLAAAPLAASGFAGWGGACTGTGTCALTITADTAITAAFTLNDTTLVVSTGGNGTGTVTSSPAGISCPTDCEQTYPANTMVTLTATAAASGTFTGWSGACSGLGACTVTMSQARTVTASFALKTYRLTVGKAGTGSGSVTSSPAGITCGTDCTETYNHGQLVTLTAAAATGSTFTGWSGACTGVGTCTLTMDAVKTATATFDIRQIKLTVVMNGGTSGGLGTIASTPAGFTCASPGPCSKSYPYNQVVSLAATPTAGSLFIAWSGGGCSGNTACGLTLTADVTITAGFSAPNVAFVTSTTVAGTFGTVSSPFLYADGVCTSLASQAGLVGTGPGKNQVFLAYLSTNTINAASRFAGSSGWIRTDDRPVVGTLADFASNTVVFPLRFAETGADLGGGQTVWTGSNANGTYNGDACVAPGSTATWGVLTTTATVGMASATSAQAIGYASQSCATPRHFYCFGIGRDATVAVTPIANAREAFTSTALFVPSTGIAAADAICQSEATTASLAGSWKALLSTTTTAAIQRFTMGTPWVRRKDGVPLTVATSSLFSSATTTLDSAPNVTAMGARTGGLEIWTGSISTALTGNSSGTCANWTNNAQKGMSGVAWDTGMSQMFFSGESPNSASCALAKHVVCLQE